MDDVLIFLFVPLLALIGWIVGIVGFFRAGRALAELAALRRELAAGAVAVPAREIAAAFAEPVPETTPLPALTEAPQAAAHGDGDAASDQDAGDPTAGEPAPPPRTVIPPAREPARDIEALLTLRWGLWLGAAAILMSGVFLIRYAADQGLLGPATRCLGAALLGVAMLAAAEWLRRRPPVARRHDETASEPAAGIEATGTDPPVAAASVDERADPWAGDQAPAALAAGGVALLFGAAYGAGPFYELVPPAIAFALLAAASATGLVTSLRFGQLVAAVGITGGFVTPLLVQTNDPSLPGLYAYLLAVAAASLAVVRYTAWTWLGWATTIACALWTLAGGLDADAASIWAPSLFVPAAAALNLFLLPPQALDHPIGKRLASVPFAALAGALLLVETAHDADWPRAGVLLLIPLAVGKGAREARLDRLPWLAALAMLLCLLLWDLPSWQPTGEVVTAGAVLPGAFAPDAIVPFLLTAAAASAVLAIAGLLLERRAARPLHWAALPAAVPVLTIAVAYTQVARFRPSIEWGLAALALAAILVATTGLARREGDDKRAGAHAAGAVAAIALAFAMVLREQWLTVAVSLVLPPLALIETRSGLAALRPVARIVASLILIRLALNWYVLDYDFGTGPFANELLATYLVPAIGFGLASRLFRERDDDATVALLEAGAVLFVSILIALEIRQWQGGGDFRATGSLDEFALHVATLAVQGYVNLRIALRGGRAVLLWAARIQGGLALIGGIALLAFNPLFVEGGSWVTLIAGYLLPALLAVVALPSLPDGRGRGLLGVYAVMAGFVWLMLVVRALFHPGAMPIWTSNVDDAELWAWSGAGLAYGAALMALGIARQGRAGGKPLRLASLAIIALMSAKVFLIDMAGLEGLWRVVSFLGLGLMLIALGAVYRRFVVPPSAHAPVDTMS